MSNKEVGIYLINKSRYKEGTMKIKCLLCGDIIESKSVHDLVSCKCESCYVDGGEDYLHFGGKDFDKILIIFNDKIGRASCRERV